MLRRVLGQPQFAIVMLTVGIGFMLRGLASMVPGWGTETYTIKTPYSGEVLRAGGVALSAEYLMVIVMTILLCSALYTFFRFTRIGACRSASNQLAAYYMDPGGARQHDRLGDQRGGGRVRGAAARPITFVHTNMGFIGLKFPAAVIGGFGSVPGAIAGGVIIGVVEALAGFYLPEGFKDIAAYIVVLVVLMVRPHGLSAAAEERRSERCASSSRRATSRTSAVKHGGQTFWYGLLGLALAAAPLLPEYYLSQLTFVCIYALVGVEAHGLHRPDLARPRRLPGRRRLYRGGAAGEGRALRRFAYRRGALAGIAGIVIGLPALRLTGIYLAIATIAFGFIVQEAVTRWESVTRAFRHHAEVDQHRVGPVRRGVEALLLALALLLVCVLNS